MAKNAMPVSKAKTAYGLLSEIRKLILEEPKRYDQSSFVPIASSRANRPACGTVCCVAGWATALKNPALLNDSIQTSRFARYILGLELSQHAELVNPDAAGPCDARPSLHAKRGAAHIARFQKKYAKQLKATRV